MTGAVYHLLHLGVVSWGLCLLVITHVDEPFAKDGKDGKPLSTTTWLLLRNHGQFVLVSHCQTRFTILSTFSLPSFFKPKYCLGGCSIPIMVRSRAADLVKPRPPKVWYTSYSPVTQHWKTTIPNGAMLDLQRVSTTRAPSAIRTTWTMQRAQWMVGAAIHSWWDGVRMTTGTWSFMLKSPWMPMVHSNVIKYGYGSMGGGGS